MSNLEIKTPKKYLFFTNKNNMFINSYKGEYVTFNENEENTHKINIYDIYDENNIDITFPDIFNSLYPHEYVWDVIPIHKPIFKKPYCTCDKYILTNKRYIYDDVYISKFIAALYPEYIKIIPELQNDAIYNYVIKIFYENISHIPSKDLTHETVNCYLENLHKNEWSYKYSHLLECLSKRQDLLTSEIINKSLEENIFNIKYIENPCEEMCIDLIKNNYKVYNDIKKEYITENMTKLYNELWWDSFKFWK